MPSPRRNLACSAICFVESSALVNKVGKSFSDLSVI